MPANKKTIAGMARSYKFNNPNVFHNRDINTLSRSIENQDARYKAQEARTED